MTRAIISASVSSRLAEQLEQLADETGASVDEVVEAMIYTYLWWYPVDATDEDDAIAAADALEHQLTPPDR